MSGATAADYAWFDEKYGESLCVTGFCLLFVRQVSPEEAFRRVGVTAEPVEPSGWSLQEHPLAAYPAVGGSVLLEAGGRMGTLVEVTRRLSAGTVMATVFLGVDDQRQFLYAADGRLVTGFETDGPDSRWGDAPDRLADQMREIGIPVDEKDVDDRLDDEEFDPVLAAMALAERATGVRVTAAHLGRPALVGSARHLY
ncbi:DUF6461 domain-containing protein [Sphaerisporangium fuscum]|uniref:DUF6461 domain-containing protein n=1 Tax=Sphaerisporangium fuscum TaxID=2835868 RepID=UPI001BDC425A|nr:DUF6461 domain-containing protein [Sphaerisporangium fuscum]